MLTDLKVVETSNKDNERTVEKIKEVDLIGKESWYIYRQHISEGTRSPMLGKAPFYLLASAFLSVPGNASKVRFGAWDHMKTPYLVRKELETQRRVLR